VAQVVKANPPELHLVERLVEDAPLEI